MLFPAVFHQPLGPHTPLPPVAPGSILASVQRPYLKVGASTAPASLTSTPVPSWHTPDATHDLLNPPVSMGRNISPVSGMESLYVESMMNMNGSMGPTSQQHMIYSMDSPESNGNSLVNTL